MVEISIIR